MTEKQKERLEKEKVRIAQMRAFEKELVEKEFAENDSVQKESMRKDSMQTESLQGEPETEPYVLVCGIDEAGRGPLAGPVTAGAVILPPDHDILYINDSKKLSPKKREMLYEQITSEAVSWAVASVTPQRIDEINILQATYEAVRTAVARLDPAPSVLVNDAVTIPGISIRQIPVVKGDAKCISVAAASILAKVTRDRYMAELDEKYPEYGFAKHKGYGTKAHIEALKQYGPCPEHRRTFITHFVNSQPSLPPDRM